MAEKNLVVARFADGSMIKGSTDDFFPERPLFHIQTKEGTKNVRMRDLKAVFFVRSLAGDPTHNKSREFTAASENEQGRKVAVLFKDGELMTGHTLTYLPGKQGFFLFPADREGNNLRVYVVTTATKAVRVGPAAEQLIKSTPRKSRPKATPERHAA
jgi:hypothetical protein